MKKVMLGWAIAAVLSVVPSISFATSAVPNVIGYHGVLFDEGGNPIADGETGIWFRILDAAGSVLFEERQTVAARGGAVAALVGNGFAADGAPAGGVPWEAIDPRDIRFLEVEVEGLTKEAPLELAAVPYAAYAQQALGVADKAIAFKALSDGAIDGIAAALTDGKDATQILLRDELPTLYSAPSAAATIGVAPGLAYSSAPDLQTALIDLDAAIAQRAAAITSEAGTRVAADAAEAGARAVADAAASAALADLQSRTAAVEEPQRLSFQRSSWGSVSCGPAPTIQGENVQVSYVGVGSCRITFMQAMADTAYAAVVTPEGAVPPGSIPFVAQKTTDGFTVTISGAASFSFAFVVTGR